MNVLKKAHDIAVRDLRACYTPDGIVAGLHHFSQYWARDSFFASLGVLALDDHDVVKRNLLLFLSTLRDGQLPLRIKDAKPYQMGLRFLGCNIDSNNRTPLYRQDKGSNITVDQNSLFILALTAYSNLRGIGFYKKHSKKIKQIIEWNLGLTNNNLIEEEVYGHWADSVRKKGKTLFSNVLHCAALKAYSDLAAGAGQDSEAILFNDLYTETKKELMNAFWNGSFLSDWIDEERHDYFSTDGNVLSIVYGIVTKKEGLSIQNEIEKRKINNPLPSRTNAPRYPNKFTSRLDSLFGVGEYHNHTMIWLWLGCADAVSKYRLGLKKEAKITLEKIAEVIVQFNGVFEVYTVDGEPFRSWFYRSEQPFAWSSGMFIWAVSEVYGSI